MKHNQIPSHPHYAAIEFGSVWIPGDERSRTNPGHGYPEHSETTLSYIAFDSKEEMEAWVERQEKSARTYGGTKNYHVMFVTPAQITVATKVTITTQRPTPQPEEAR